MEKIIKIIIFLSLFHPQHSWPMKYDKDFINNNLSNFCIKHGVGILTAKFLQYRGHSIDESSFYGKLLISSLPEITNIFLGSWGKDQKYINYFDEHYKNSFNSFFWLYALEPEIKLIFKIMENMIIERKSDTGLSKKLYFQLSLTVGVNILQKTTILFADTIFKK